MDQGMLMSAYLIASSRRHMIIWPIVAAATAILAAACATPSFVAERERALFNESRIAFEMDDIALLEKKEPEAISAAQGSATRDGSVLTLNLLKGGKKVYRDSEECAGTQDWTLCTSYLLIGHGRSNHIFLLAKFQYEFTEFILVDEATGEETSVRSFPSFSPSGRYVLVLIMNDEELGFAVQVWRRNGSKFILDWSGFPGQESVSTSTDYKLITYTDYKLTEWSNDNKIDLQARLDFLGREQAVHRYSLHNSELGWTIKRVQ